MSIIFLENIAVFSEENQRVNLNFCGLDFTKVASSKREQHYILFGNVEQDQDHELCQVSAGE